ncbi:MAG TPA: hypothetical protein VEC06_21090 [Paucimonas sp.]|nr:hypothetical protein [Paucimonas sp.]
MKIALISERGRLAVEGLAGTDWKLFNFRISTGPISFLNIIDSGFGTPARYLMSLFNRLLKSEFGSTASPKLLFNPLFELDHATILIVLERAGRNAGQALPTIFCDGDGYPLAYLLPASLTFSDAKYLSLLSTVDAVLDQTSLNGFFGWKTSIECMPKVGVNMAFLHRFQSGPCLDIYRWVARAAVDAMRAHSGIGERKNSRLPFSVIMPHHAGDLLFLSLASQRLDTHFSTVVANRAYAEIVKNNAKGLNILQLELPPLNRDGARIPEWKYFEAIQKMLPCDRLYYYARPTRDYDTSSFHLIDQFAFALGNEYYSGDELLIRSSRSSDARILAAGETFNVLLHFDSGWPLKMYPPAYQKELVELLSKHGYRITALDGQHELPCPNVAFRSYRDFTELLRTQHILVGMDSFPAHYAAHVSGLPTICLFSSTRPENSNAPRAMHYRHLERGLECRPCRAVEKCPLNGRAACNNFVAPAVVAQEVENMLNAVYRRSDGIQK